MIRSPEAQEDNPAGPRNQPDRTAQAVTLQQAPAAAQPLAPVPDQIPHPSPVQPPSQDLAALLTAGLTNVQTSMGAMEACLAGKIDSLEASVSKNKETIVVLTDMVSKNTVDLAGLEAEIRSNDNALDGRVADLVRHHTAELDRSSCPDPPRPGRVSPAQASMF